MMPDIDPDKPGLIELLRGKGETHMQMLAWAGTIIIPFLCLVQLFVWLG